MLKISDQLTFIFDPGHGWLRVPLADIAALGIEGDISEYSFIDGSFAYHSAALTTCLEEDCDYAVFVAACDAHKVPLPEIRDRYVERFDRDRPRFGDPRFSPEFWNKLRR
ncbi:MAG TPA: hypothetical protein ENK32_07185 [Anaerolineae bacterium]|nr:hypothetical protein [Anaerolineae bacterium]